MSRPQRRRSPPAGATSPPTCLHVVPKRFTRNVSDFSHAGGKPGKACRSVASGGCAGPRPRQSQPAFVGSCASSAAHAAPALGFLGKVCRAGGVRFMRLWGGGVLVRPLRLHLVPQKASMCWSRNLTLGCRCESLHHRATGMEIIGILVQLSNMGYDSLSTRLSILLC